MRGTIPGQCSRYALLATCNIVSRGDLFKSCGMCRRFQRDHKAWDFTNPRKTWTLEERIIEESWENHVSRLMHEYETHDVPHREITGRDNYFMSISEISKFANPEFTKNIKATVKGRASYRCECCGRSWTDITHPDEETFYFKTLENLWNQELVSNEFKLSELGRATFAEYAVSAGLNRCKNCGTILHIGTGWWTEEPKPIRPSRWFQVHHKNFQHFDNRLANLESLCGNCHSAKGRWNPRDKKKTNWPHGIDYVRGLIDYLQSRGLTMSYIFLSRGGAFSWAVIGERQD